MAMTVVNEGELDLLAVNKADANTNWRVGLYTAIAGGLSDTTVLADITAATFGGAAPQTPVYGSISTVGGTASMTAAALTFTLASGGPETILGYVVKNNSTGKLIKVQPFAASQLMSSVGDAIVVTETFLLKGSITS